MTDTQQDHDELYDIMQLIEAPTAVLLTAPELAIKPDMARIKQSLATPEAINRFFAKLMHNTLRIEGIEGYFEKYALKKLIQETPGKKVYMHYEKYKKKTFARLNLAILKHTEHISLSKRLTPYKRTLLQAYRFWNTLTEQQQRERCCSIMLIDDNYHSSFIDLRFFYKPLKKKKKHIEDYEENDDDDMEHPANFSECCFMGQSGTLPGSIDSQLTVEEAVQAIVEHIATRDLDLNMTDSQATDELREVILEKIETKQRRNQKRITSLIDGLTITTLLHRARAKPGEGYPKATPERPTRLSVAEFPLFTMDMVLTCLMSTRKRNQLLSLPEPEQRAHLKYHIQGLTLSHAIPMLSHDMIKKMGYQLPFIVNLVNLTTEIRNKIRQESFLNETDYSRLHTVAHSALKRFRTMSECDRNMFIHLERIRSASLLGIAKDNYQYKEGVPLKYLDTLRTSRFFADLYMSATDAGIRVAKLRNLVKKVYLPLPSDEYARMNLAYNGAAHDVLTNYEPNFMTFLNGWNKHPRFAPVINQIIDLLISQLGGAKGELNKAFASWNKLPTLVGKELLLLNSQPKNLEEIFHLTKINPAYIKKATPLLNTLPASMVSQEHLHQYVSNSVGNEAFYHYLVKLNNTRRELAQKLEPITPALTHPKHRALGGLFFDILPYDDLLGSLGVATQGVCIRFGSEPHLQHQTPAIANLIIRDDKKVWLWGLLIRAQNTEKPTYLLNNLQGAFPSRYAKHKAQIRDTIRSFLSEIGTVYSLDFYFNALELLGKDEKVSRSRGSLIVPKMRLDLNGEAITTDTFDHPHPERFMEVNLAKVYKISVQLK